MSHELKRDLGPWAAASIVVGTVIGSGIFIVPNTMTQRLGSAEWVFFVWVFGGLLSLSGALTYAELSAALPGAGGEYVYLKLAYGPLFSFIYGWTQTWVAKSGSIATLATAFFLYFGNFRPEVNTVAFTVPLPIGPDWKPLEVTWGQLLAMILIMGLGGVNYCGVKLGGRVQVVVTICKVGLIGGVILFGLTFPGGSASNLVSHTPAAAGIAGFFAALVSALWAYDGWNNVGMVASEIREPQRNLPRALIFGTIAVIAIYLLANAAYFFVLNAGEVANSRLVAAEMMRRVAGQNGADAVSIAAMISIFAALNGSILSGSRVPYAMAFDGFFFSPLASVNERYRTPGVAILLLSAWSAILVLSGRYDQLVTLVIFPSWILYGMTTASVLVLRRKEPDLPRPYRTLGYPVVPIVFVFVALALLVSTLLDSPRESGLGLVLIATGLPFYSYWKRRRS
jgi:APA family basic amino acid/polyamine antiporter